MVACLLRAAGGVPCRVRAPARPGGCPAAAAPGGRRAERRSLKRMLGELVAEDFPPLRDAAAASFYADGAFELDRLDEPRLVYAATDAAVTFLLARPENREPGAPVWSEARDAGRGAGKIGGEARFRSKRLAPMK